MNKIQWNFSQKSNFLIEENGFDNVVYEMAPILSRGRWVKCMSVPGLVVLSVTDADSPYRCMCRRSNKIMII